MSKTLTCIRIEPDGKLALESVVLKKTREASLEIPKMNASQGPEFIREKYSYVLHFSTAENIGEINKYSGFFLDVFCNDEPQTNNYVHRGNFYLTKHCPDLREDHKFDFSKAVPDEEILKYDTHVDCAEEDLEFIGRELQKRTNTQERAKGILCVIS